MSRPSANSAMGSADSNGHAVGVGLRSEPSTLLTPGDVEAIAEATARKLVEIVGEPARTFGLVGARELAQGLGVSLDYVYAHATELGGMRLGSGPKARIRFDLDRARQVLEARTQRSNGKRRR
jgi:hypothetical protein